MTYNPAIPQSYNIVSQSQAQILANFNQLNEQFGSPTSNVNGDHNSLYNGSSNGNGHHRQVRFDGPISVGGGGLNPPAPTGTQSIIYPATVSGIQQLFFRNATNTYQITTAGGGTNTFNSYFSSSGGQVNFSPEINTMNYSVVGGITIFVIYISSLQIQSGNVGTVRFLLPSVPTVGGFCIASFSGSNPDANHVLSSIITQSDQCITNINAAVIGTQPFNASGFYI